MPSKARDLGEFATSVKNVGTSFVEFNRDIVATGGTIGGNTIATTNSLPSLGNDFVDSAEVIKLINANSLDSALALQLLLDSSEIVSLIDSAYIQARETEDQSLLNALIFGG